MSHSDRPAEPCAADATASAESLPREDFLQVFLSQRPRMEALVQRRVGCRATAADLVQDLFLRFWKRPQAPVEELGSYLLRSARNLAIDHLRGEDSRGRTLSALLPDDDDAQPSPEQAVQAGAELDLVESALRQLPERTRHIFLLSRVHGRTYGEIATAMGLSQSAVEKHMMRALDACKASLELAAPATRRGAADR
ncbi:sigma-70 family RNA polymerase sigma factor [Pseudomonas nicosulfuronedens]|uniref:RNA polymerase sigma factor n=1 Tax=Pseudomonas nicosulfuronedens TaxID=2571105 RepID=UPI001FE8504B|nr:sigma-70 family RNA polymerase sigma factor [Pseudomonas nicosulfuronedens]MDH1012131.1 sigma-70 family RNA polymerase sigma factor [Pseudomonas nicosulfuronedens]MDH1982467.1 sigma-70 family RNA polymerase sigma factor [Pseudomonas nicosulfuronedens]MDH2030150.1 sigma-70 family RNA polymerase sigma factor [Pseudomonas nicosulfuronedens]